jgi:CzcA family heavy metal efflux pump
LIAGVAVLIAGVWAGTHARLDALPDFTPPRVVIQTEAAGMGTSDVEELVTSRVERAVLGTPDAVNVRSVSTPGLSIVIVTFADSVDVYQVRQLVNERLTLVRAGLPSSANDPRLAPVSAPIGALLKFTVTSARGADAMREVRTFAEWTLRPRLLAIPGVSQVIVHGGEIERVEVRPDPLRMRQVGVSLSDVIEAVRNSQTTQGGGFVETTNVRADVQNAARLTTTDADAALGSLAVRNSKETTVRLAQVAGIVHASAPPVGAALYDGQPAVYVQVNKLPAADTVTVTDAVEKVIAQIARSLPAGARIEPPVFRQASFIRTSLHSVGRAMLIGSLLVVVVLVAFLRFGRLAIISLTAIPLSILMAVSILVAFGASINGMTLGGLAIAVGEVVDDAIVDVENVWRRLRENAASNEPRPALQVIHDASLEIRGSVVYATMIVILVLLPVLLLGGVAGKIFAPLAEAYIFAIGASLLVALTVTPAMCAWLLPRIAKEHPQPARVASALASRYAATVRWVIDRPRQVFTAIAFLLVIAGVALLFIGGGFLPEFRESSLIAEVNAAPGSALGEVVRMGQRIDRQLRPGGAVHTAARIGRAELDEDASPLYRIEMDIVLKPDDSRALDEISFDLSKRVASVPGVGFTVEGFLSERINEILSGETSPVVVKVAGPDLAQLRSIAARIAQEMQQTPGLTAIRPEPQIDIPQIRIRPNRSALAQYGVTPSQLSDEIAGWRQGVDATEILGENGQTIGVAVAGPPELRSWSRVADLPISTGTKGGLTLSDLATVEQAREPVTIQHEDGQRRISIGADARGSGVSRAVSALRSRLAAIGVPAGYSVTIAGQSVARGQAATRLLLIGALVLLAIFVLLTMAFSSMSDAGIVLLNFPLGLIGGVLAATLAPGGLSVAGFVGFVTLFGIIARNGIMLVAHKRLLDEELPDVPPIERIVRAAEERLLPIVMTAAAAGLGLLPLAFSLTAAGSELEAPMALIVIGGLITSTALNMLVLPTIYVWRERRREAHAQ